jgi:hypothetical protein
MRYTLINYDLITGCWSPVRVIEAEPVEDRVVVFEEDDEDWVFENQGHGVYSEGAEWLLVPHSLD